MTRLRTDRLEALRAVMAERSVDHLWIEPSVGFRYLTGTEPVSFERLAGLLIPTDGDLRAVAPEMAVEELEPLGIEIESWSDSDGPEDAVSHVLSGVDSLSIQGSLPAWAWDTLAKASPATSIGLDPGTLSSLREVKDEDELESLRRSAALADEVAGWIAGQDLAGMEESQLTGRIQAYFLERGATPWPPLVATGANAAMPHYIDATSKIDPNVPLLCDFGATLGAYLSDMTRVFFPPQVAPEVASAYEIVCAAYDAALATVADGVPCAEVDRAARRVIEDSGYGDAFIHRTGHGVGLELHEPPYLHGANETPLRVGNVFSIEPGIYIPGSFGLRYENLVHLGPDGPEVLNRAPRELKLST
jgi:Xaa-Pro dipeptidase